MNFLPPKTRFQFLTRRTACPSCGARHGWAGLKGFDQNFGFCHACGHKNFPTENFREKTAEKRVFERQLYEYKVLQKKSRERPLNGQIEGVLNTISTPEFESTLVNREKNDFFQFLRSFLPPEKAAEIFDFWSIGTGENGAAIFWHLDVEGRVRYGKKIWFDAATGKKKRLSAYKNFTTENGCRPCVFGESELVKNRTAPAVFVESEKNAILGKLFFSLPAVWLATGGTNGLTKSKIEPLVKFLKFRKIFTVFDADDAGRKGAEKIKTLLAAYGLACEALDLFPEKSDGFDIGDAILERLKVQNPPAENDSAFDWILTGISPDENEEWLAALGIEKEG